MSHPQESDFDKELEQLFDIEPSAGFTGRLRQRIAMESAPHRLSWWPVMAAYAVVGVVIVFALVGPRRQEQPSSLAQLASTSPTASAAEPQVVRPIVHNPRPGPRKLKKVPIETQFFTGKTEAREFADLFHALDQGRVNLPKVLFQGDPARSIQPFAELSVEPLVLAPITIEPLNSEARERTIP